MKLTQSRGGTPLKQTAIKRIQSDLKEISKYPLEGVAVVPDEQDIGSWRVFLEGPKGTPFEGGIYELTFSFPHDYPANPPVVYFASKFYHPNVYPDGKICASILHAPGDDQMAGESFEIRWKPINSVSSVINSILLLLMEPNFSSPANVDASVMWRNQPEQYLARAKELAALAQKEFVERNGDVFIPHPDTNEGERMMYRDMNDESKKATMVEVWDSSDDEQEWGSFSSSDAE